MRSGRVTAPLAILRGSWCDPAALCWQTWAGRSSGSRVPAAAVARHPISRRRRGFSARPRGGRSRRPGCVGVRQKEAELNRRAFSSRRHSGEDAAGVPSALAAVVHSLAWQTAGLFRPDPDEFALFTPRFAGLDGRACRLGPARGGDPSWLRPGRLRPADPAPRPAGEVQCLPACR